MPYVLYHKSGKTAADAKSAEWKRIRSFETERKARDSIGSTRAVHARTGLRYSQFKVEKE